MIMYVLTSAMSWRWCTTLCLYNTRHIFTGNRCITETPLSFETEFM